MRHRDAGVDIARVLRAGCRVRARLRSVGWSRQADGPEGDDRAMQNQGIDLLVVCAPDEADRPARNLARCGECVFPLGSGSAGERGAWRTEDSGP